MNAVPRSLAAAALALVAAAPPPARTAAPAVPASAVAGIEVAFKIDPRITRGLYMGDRWASPARTSRVQDGKTLAVEARVVALVGRRRDPVAVEGTWSMADPAVASVAPARGHAATLTAHRPGRTRLTVSLGAFTRTYDVHVVKQGGVLRVELSREDVPEHATARAGAAAEAASP